MIVTVRITTVRGMSSLHLMRQMCAVRRATLGEERPAGGQQGPGGQRLWYQVKTINCTSVTPSLRRSEAPDTVTIPPPFINDIAPSGIPLSIRYHMRRHRAQGHATVNNRNRAGKSNTLTCNNNKNCVVRSLTYLYVP